MQIQHIEHYRLQQRWAQQMKQTCVCVCVSSSDRFHGWLALASNRVIDGFDKPPSFANGSKYLQRLLHICR